MKVLSFPLLAALVALLVAGALTADHARAQTRSAQPKADATQEYLARAGMGDLFEMRSSKLALERGRSEAVKNFAAMMVKDHTESTKKLQAAAKADKQTAAPPEKLDVAHQEKYAKLEKADAAAFDEAYIQAQLDAHEQALDLHSAYAKSGESPAIKAAAAEIAKVVEHHRDEARKIAAKTK